MFEKIYKDITKVYNKVVLKVVNARNNIHNKLPRNAKYFDGSLYDAVYNSALKYPHNIAIEYDDIQITYRSLIRKINKVAKALKYLGVQKGDCVTICMPNTPEEVITFYAINEIGAVANMIHPLSSEVDMAYYISKSNSKVILCIDANYGKILNILDQTNIEHVIIASATKSMSLYIKIMYWLTQGRKIKVKEDKKVILWKHFISCANRYEDDPYENVESDDDAVILYSGGTTGKSKGVVISNKAFNAQALQSVYVDKTLADSQNAFLTFLPNFHAFGLGICTHIPLYHGMRVVLIAKFNGKKIKNYLRKYHFNVLCGVPTFYDYMSKLHFKKNELKCLKLVVCGGDALSLDLKRRINETLEKYGSKTEIQVGYGLTEVAGVVALSPKGIKDSSDIIGLPFPDNNFMIIDPETHKELGINETGELIISGPNIMKGYLGEEEETNNTIFEYKGKKWVHTGDLCYIDKKGLVHYKTRLKRMIITNGYNVYPSHVEEILRKCSNVKDVVVVGVPDEARGEIVKAYIVLKDDKDKISSRIQISKIAKENLAKYEQPRDIKFIDEIPKTLLGKTAYKELEKKKD